MALVQILPTTVKERQFPSFLACVYNSIPSPKKTLPASAFFFSKMWTFILDLILHFRSCKNKPVIFQTITRYHFLLLLFYPLFFWKIFWISCESIFSATLALLTYQTHFWLISLIASVSLITRISIISIKSVSVLIYCTFYKYLSLILHIKVSKIICVSLHLETLKQQQAVAPVPLILAEHQFWNLKMNYHIYEKNFFIPETFGKITRIRIYSIF